MHDYEFIILVGSYKVQTKKTDPVADVKLSSFIPAMLFAACKHHQS